MSPVADIALVSLGTTPGLVRSDDAFASLVRRAGASCEVVPVQIGSSGRLRRHPAVTDLVEALAARRSARGLRARAVVYSTITAALLQRPEAPYGVRFDAIAALNRPGAAAAVQGETPPTVRVPIPIEEIDGTAERDVDAVAYTGYPRKRGLELLCAAWAEAAPPGARLVVGGTDRAKGAAWLRRTGVPEPDGVEWAGALPRERWLDLVRRARLFLNASHWEDFGIAPMEALAAGTPLVTVPTPGSFEALSLARELAPDLVAVDVSADSLAVAIRAGFALDDERRRRYGERALELLRPYREEAIGRIVSEHVLPALGIGAA